MAAEHTIVLTARRDSHPAIDGDGAVVGRSSDGMDSDESESEESDSEESSGARPEGYGYGYGHSKRLAESSRAGGAAPMAAAQKLRRAHVAEVADPSGAQQRGAERCGEASGVGSKGAVAVSAERASIVEGRDGTHGAACAAPIGGADENGEGAGASDGEASVIGSLSEEESAVRAAAAAAAALAGRLAPSDAGAPPERDTKAGVEAEGHAETDPYSVLEDSAEGALVAAARAAGGSAGAQTSAVPTEGSARAEESVFRLPQFGAAVFGSGEADESSSESSGSSSSPCAESPALPVSPAPLVSIYKARSKAAAGHAARAKAGAPRRLVEPSAPAEPAFPGTTAAPKAAARALRRRARDARAERERDEGRGSERGPGEALAADRSRSPGRREASREPLGRSGPRELAARSRRAPSERSGACGSERSQLAELAQERRSPQAARERPGGPRCRGGSPRRLRAQEPLGARSPEREPQGVRSSERELWGREGARVRRAPRSRSGSEPKGSRRSGARSERRRHERTAPGVSREAPHGARVGGRDGRDPRGARDRRGRRDSRAR